MTQVRPSRKGKLIVRRKYFIKTPDGETYKKWLTNDEALDLVELYYEVKEVLD